MGIVARISNGGVRGKLGQAQRAWVLHAFMIVVALSCLFKQAEAALISANDPVFGNDSLTIDTGTRLAWLDLAFTNGRSFDDVSSELGVGGEFEGYRYATRDEVFSFFAN